MVVVVHAVMVRGMLLAVLGGVRVPGVSGVSGRRGGTARVWRVPASRLGWAPVAAVPDLEAWWGGWG